MPLVTVGKRRLHYLDTGGEGPAVVLTHGVTRDAESLRRQLDGLGSDCRVIAWDQRNHGRSSVVPAPHDYWDSATDLARLLDAIGIDRAVVGGTSQGGFVSLRFALRYPERCAGLVLAATHASGSKYGKSSRISAQISAFARAWHERGPSAHLIEELRHLLGSAELDDEPRWLAAVLARPAGWLEQVYNVVTERDDIHHLLGALKVPVLVIEGERDVVVTRAMVDRMCAAIPTIARREVIAGAGHHLMQTHPEQVNSVLREYLRTLRLRGREIQTARSFSQAGSCQPIVHIHSMRGLHL